MEVIVPITVTDTVLISSTVPETDYAEWNAATSYAIGTKCIRLTTHRIYESLTGGVDANPPEDATGGDTPKWLDCGATNRWAMFDDEVGSATTSATSISVELAPGRGVGGIALMELVGSSVTVTVESEDGGDVVFQRTTPLDGAVITSFFDWFFEDFRQKTAVVHVGVPDYFPNCRITIAIEPVSSESACGVCKFGKATNLGGTQYGVTYGITDYSRKERNEFGRYVIVPRSWSKKVTCRTIFSRSELARVTQTLADLRTVPSVWVTDPEVGFESLTVFGFAADFNVDVQFHSHYYCSLEIEGLI